MLKLILILLAAVEAIQMVLVKKESFEGNRIACDYRPWRRLKNGTAESRVLFAFGRAIECGGIFRAVVKFCMNEIGMSFFTYFRSFRDIYIVVAYGFCNK